LEITEEANLKAKVVRNTQLNGKYENALTDWEYQRFRADVPRHISSNREIIDVVRYFHFLLAFVDNFMDD
jgi:hypothetical protein